MTDVKNLTPLHLAAQQGHVKVMEVLLEHKGEKIINAEGGLTENHESRRLTPLHYAIRKGTLDGIQLLLNKGANVKARDVNGRTSLHFAAFEENVNVIKLLLKCDSIDVDARDLFRTTPLHFAATAGNQALLQRLLQGNANLDLQDQYGSTPLHLATRFGCTGTVQALLSAGAKTDLIDADEKLSPPGYAKKMKNQKMMNLFDKHQNDQRIMNTVGSSSSKAAQGKESKNGKGRA